MSELILFGRPLPDLPVTSTLPDWQQADPRWMASALQIALGRPAAAGSWWTSGAASARPRTSPRPLNATASTTGSWSSGTDRTG